MKLRFLRIWILLGVMTPLLPAAVVARVSLEEMVSRSQWIVHGLVRESWPAWDNSRQVIWTHHRIEIRDALKGGETASIIVSEPGGSVGDMSMGVSGAVPYGTGEEVVLFLYRTPIGYRRAVGLGQGKFTLGRSGKLRADLGGMEIVDPIGKPMPRNQAAVESLDGLTLDEFKQRIRSLLGRARPAAVR